MWRPNYQEGTSYSFPYRGLSWINDLVLVDEEEEEDKVDHSDKGLPVENDNVTVRRNSGEGNEVSLAQYTLSINENQFVFLILIIFLCLSFFCDKSNISHSHPIV